MTAADLGLFLGPLGLQVLAGLAIGLALLIPYRWMRAQTTLGAAVFAAGLLMRASLGVVLFWISWLNLPFLQDMHLGNGHWALAPDAMMYMNGASRAAVDGLDTISRGSPSPAYVKTVALWMRLVGISPLSGMYLNLVVYAVLCIALVAIWRPKNDRRADLPLLVMLVAFSFSPVQVIHGSQSLKDDVFAFVIALGALGALFIAMPTLYGIRSSSSRWVVAAGALAWLGALYFAAGVRTYFAFFMLCSLVGALLIFGVRPRWDTLYRRVPLTLAVSVASAWVYLAGAGPYDTYLRPTLAAVWANPEQPESPEGTVMSTVLGRLNSARRGFANSGGGTNIVVAAPGSVPDRPASRNGRAREPRPSRAEVIPATAGGYFQRAAIGLGTLFVPISLLQSLDIVNLRGGRGLLFVTDVDTLFIDLTILVSLALLYSRWHIAKHRLPFISYLFLLGGGTSILLAYVVTNFGTQFRLRSLAIVPFWLLLLATAEGRFIPSAGETSSPASQPEPAGTSG